MAKIVIWEYNHKALSFPYIVKKLHAGIMSHYDIHIVFTVREFNEGDTLVIGNEAYLIKNLAGEREAKGDFAKEIEEGIVKTQPRWIKARCKFIPEEGNIFQQKMAQL